jgi:hypothetical protein
MTDQDAERRKRTVRTSLLLGLLALTFYVGFILVQLLRSRGAA